MTAITLATLRTRVRQLGSYDNSGVFTDAFINAQLNDAIGEYCDLLDATWEGYRDTVTTLSTVANTATVSLPATFHKLRALDILYNGLYSPLRRLSLRQTYGYDYSSDVPAGYILRAGLSELFPTPNAVYTLRIRYVPTSDVLSSDSDSVDVPNGWDGFIIHTALLKLDEREERSVVERLAIIDRYRQRITSAAQDRGAAEPEYLAVPDDIGGYL